MLYSMQEVHNVFVTCDSISSPGSGVQSHQVASDQMPPDEVRGSLCMHSDMCIQVSS